MLDLLRKCSHAFEVALGRREIELVVGHGFRR